MVTTLAVSIIPAITLLTARIVVPLIVYCSSVAANDRSRNLNAA